YHGLALAKNHGLRKEIIESDALEAINMIQGGVPSSSIYYHSFRQIIENSCVVGDVKLTHVVREANQAVDALAKHGLNLDSELNIFHIVPDFFVDCLRSDSLGVACSRFS
ncbi:ribonuclease H protein, partial [Trifolium medium]|nr:ribonuclease H protein [Trifolium medium]